MNEAQRCLGWEKAILLVEVNLNNKTVNPKDFDPLPSTVS